MVAASKTTIDLPEHAAEHITKRIFYKSGVKRTHEEYCDFKRAIALRNILLWEKRAAKWLERRAHQDTASMVRRDKRAERAIAKVIKLGLDDAAIKKLISAQRHKSVAS